MASERQIQANRANAKLSTGPRTDEGKAIARRNALTTGLAGLGLVRPEHWETEILEHADWLQSKVQADNQNAAKLSRNPLLQQLLTENGSRFCHAWVFLGPALHHPRFHTAFTLGVD